MSDEPDDMQRGRVVKAVVHALSEATGVYEDDIKEDMELEGGVLGIDELDRIEICMDLEEELDIDSLDEEALMELKTVKELVDYVVPKLK